MSTHASLALLGAALAEAPGPGQLGVVVARAGAGKTALSTQLGVRALASGAAILHADIGGSVEALVSWYDALDADALGDQTRRILIAPEVGADAIAALTEALGTARRHMGLLPTLLIVDGWRWGEGGYGREALEALKALGRAQQAGVWVSADVYLRNDAVLPMVAAADQDLVDAALRIEPVASDLAITVARAPRLVVTSPELVLGGSDLRVRLAHERARPRAVALPALAYTLLSGGAAGAEVEFGAVAERHGVAEKTFTFSGRLAERTRGLVTLGDEALALAAASMATIEQDLKRRFPDTPLFRKVLQSIWHQVDTAGEVFAVGAIQADKTVTGGTGWAAQLATKTGKPVHVYDQDRRRWCKFADGDWLHVPAPRITATRFCGTGTRFLTDDGRAAIAELFARSFGEARGGGG